MKKNKSVIPIQPIRLPYQCESSDDFEVQYKRYMVDSERKVESDVYVYYKIMQTFLFDGKKLLVTLNSEMNLRLGDKLTDENGNIFTVESFEMINLGPIGIPDWYRNVFFCVLSGQSKEIGCYAAKLPGESDVQMSE